MYSFSASIAASLLLERDELAAGIALVGEEEQPGVELAGLGVDAVGEGVAPPEDVDPVGVLVGQAHVGVDRDGGLAVGPVAARSIGSCSCCSPIGAPSSLSRPMVCSWSPSDDRSHTSMWMRMRRTTR